MWKNTYILYLIIIYRQIIWFWGGLAIHSTHSAGQVITLFTQFRPDYFLIFSMKQRPELFSNFGWPHYLFYLQKLPDPPSPILIIIYTVCTCYTLVPTRILNSEISWSCFDFPKWGPVSFIITDFNVFVQFFE
jgi:hypothetical protein